MGKIAHYRLISNTKSVSPPERCFCLTAKGCLDVYEKNTSNRKSKRALVLHLTSAFRSFASLGFLQKTSTQLLSVRTGYSRPISQSCSTPTSRSRHRRRRRSYTSSPTQLPDHQCLAQHISQPFTSPITRTRSLKILFTTSSATRQSV